MNQKKHFPEHFYIARHLLKWTAIVLPVSLAVGSLVAFFLWALDAVTQMRWKNSWLLFLLPVAGIGIHFLYKLWGRDAGRGNNLIMEEIHQPGGGVPARMAPLVIIATLITHLSGGSAGREGTAVQIGGSMAGLWAKWLNLAKPDTRILLMCRIAAGFGAVFGTPLTGAIFALEVLAIGQIKYDALIPCLIASVLADATCGAWGIHHTKYSIGAFPTACPGCLPVDFSMLAKVIVSGVAFGLAGFLFVKAMHGIRRTAVRYIRPDWLIPVVGGFIVITLAICFHKMDYLGLGVTAQTPGGISIVRAFHAGGAEPASWLWKLLLTAVTLGCSFKGGEVTPLFFIGATLGNTLAVMMGGPVDLMAGLGFIAVFAGATNTPLACTIMGAELFGTEHVLYYAVACFTAYYFSGHSGIYSAQKLAVAKHGDEPKDSANSL